MRAAFSVHGESAHSPKPHRHFRTQPPTSTLHLPSKTRNLTPHISLSTNPQNVLRLPPPSLQRLGSNSHLPQFLMPRPPHDRARANGLPNRQRNRLLRPSAPFCQPLFNHDFTSTIPYTITERRWKLKGRGRSSRCERK
jgi:hypothetical protein